MRSSVQRPRCLVPGPVQKQVRALEDLGWSWPELDVLATDLGKVRWLEWPVDWVMHEVRAAQRRCFLRRIPRKRNDLGSIHPSIGAIDAYATTWLLRTRSKRLRLGPVQMGYLTTYSMGVTTRSRGSPGLA